jgi:hypothetical protein
MHWSGGQKLQLMPLDRSFATGTGLPDLHIEDITDSDAEEIVAQELQGTVDTSVTRDDFYALPAPDTGVDDLHARLDRFYIECENMVLGVTGYGDVPFFDYASVFEALRYLSTYERLHDRRLRSEGAVGRDWLRTRFSGFIGSGDAEVENLRSQRFQLGLRRIGLRILRRGYRPQDADDLVALCNGVLQTAQLNFAGYPKDLLWASQADQQEFLIEALGLDEADWEAWLSSADAGVDPVGRQLALSRLGEATWELLQSLTRHFLATALLHLELQGNAPQLDYAPISLEMVKGLEVELSHVLEGYRGSLKGHVPSHNAESRTEQPLVAFLKGGKPPTLGTMSYLLRQPPRNASELMRSLHRYIATLPNGEFLTSREFANQGLQRVINKYRNGGAHDSPVAQDVCQECVEVVIGTRDAPGYIPRVAAWRPPPHSVSRMP